MSAGHPALAFLQTRIPGARPVAADGLCFDVDGTRVEIFVANDDGPAWFAEGRTRLGYRCTTGISSDAKERLRRVLLDLRAMLAAARVVDAHAPLPTSGAWTDRIADGDLSTWRAFATRAYRAAIEAGRNDECPGLPDCLDLRMRPPIAATSIALQAPPASGPCARCGRARACPSARDGFGDAWKPLRHADAASAELAALRTLAAEAAVPVAGALDAYGEFLAACGDRALAGALPLEFSVRLAEGAGRPDRLRFVSYYPLVANDGLRRELHHGRRRATRTLAERWLGPPERAALDTWLACVAETQPDTLGLSLGLELDATGVRMQVYAHPGPRDDADRLARTVVQRLGGAAEEIRPDEAPSVLVGIALARDRAAALKLYRRRAWDARDDTGLQPDGLGALAPFNPGWGLAVQEHADGRAAWVKWDFPVTTHYQDYDRFLAAFWRTDDARPGWLSGAAFSAWPTWASLGRGGGRVLYFVAR